ncbi:MAG: hypothetical protein KGH63_01405 [Candidatus Micrarchaeota archaeon]|nr:hypothetical protein [Candidatus Micrarchaeota archaeon]
MGREKKPGFVFSLDAFVAFSLILIAIQSLLIISSTPRGYYRALNQADYLAQDTLQTLTVAQDLSAPSQTYMDSVSQAIASGSTLSHSSSAVKAADTLIPQPYSYAFLYYNTSNQKWVTLYNASADSLNAQHYGVPFHRVQAAAQMLVMGYSDSSPLVISNSPYCNVVCKGWDRVNGPAGGNSSASACQQVPCDVFPANMSNSGDFNVGVLRLVVWG